jgi:hypothetical protein
MKNYQIIEHMLAHDFDEFEDAVQHMKMQTMTQQEIDELYAQLESTYAQSTMDFFNFDQETPPTFTCNHYWKPIRLLNSTVYDCKHCGIKKEEVDRKS